MITLICTNTISYLNSAILLIVSSGFKGIATSKLLKLLSQIVIFFPADGGAVRVF